MITLIIAMLVSGLVIGALGRLVVPGPNPMGIFHTILVGLAGSVVGGIIGRILFGVRYSYAIGLSLAVSVLSTALIVYLIQRPRSRK
ncbi:MAG: GlsB/YeaQ/YmgE family stress response membrane protein [Acidimicrobiaceae bacterium]|nr:GlsB/YeaQ/YmgE family stress response membrane protein [Acidimicrobiaceae bacterium]